MKRACSAHGRFAPVTVPGRVPGLARRRLAFAPSRGETSEGWPVVVELSKNGKQVVRASAGIHLTCKSGGVVNVPDVYRKLTVSPSGKLNKAHTSASGKWTLKWTDHDTAGAITDTCESGSISWKAKA